LNYLAQLALHSKRIANNRKYRKLIIYTSVMSIPPLALSS
jgi:hypothetical protein